MVAVGKRGVHNSVNECDVSGADDGGAGREDPAAKENPRQSPGARRDAGHGSTHGILWTRPSPHCVRHAHSSAQFSHVRAARTSPVIRRPGVLRADLRDLPSHAWLEVIALLSEYIGPLADSMSDPSLDRPMPITTPEPNVSWAEIASRSRKLLDGHRLEALRDARTHGPRALAAWAYMEAATVWVRWQALRERFGGDDRD